jgi:hypothetical protein
MLESYPTIENPWIDPFEDVFVYLWVLSRYLKNPFDNLNIMFQPNNSIDWKVARQKIISQKNEVKMILPHIEEDFRLAKEKFGL